ncbi:MAG: MATE family efflux transporter [Spirochaetaceae bacterium]|jgi:putative MATE family efflux protein|nr:MATE family efflux transporter [Spirochaetaceae bacterium]
MTKNMTLGPPWQLIVSFSIPLIIGNLFQQLYNMADSFIVSQTIGTGALAALGSTGSLQFLILGFIVGFTNGAAVITAQRFGAGDERGVRRSFACGVIISAVITAALMIPSITFLKPLLRALNTPEEIFDDAWVYMVTMLWGMPAITLFNICSNMMRSIGDSKTPLYFLVAACILNIILDYIFILIFNMGVFGAGLATVIAQFAAGIFCIAAIRLRVKILSITAEDWNTDLKEIAVQVKVALPVGFQWSIIAIGALAVTFATNKLGTIPIAAFTAGERLDALAIFLLSSLSQAMSTFAAQNYGARKWERIRRGTLQGSAISFCLAVILGIVFIAAGRELSALFLRNEEEAIGLAYIYLAIQGGFLVFLSQLFAYRQTLIGLGGTLIPTIAGVVELVMRTIAALLLSIPLGFTGISLASPLAWAGALVPLTISLILTMKKLKRMELSKHGQ